MQQYEPLSSDRLMLTAHATDLLVMLRRHCLLDAAQLDELADLLRDAPMDAGALLQLLMQRSWLTPYQTEQLLDGQAEALVLGPYILLEPLGKGGMGHVFKARHQKLNRIVALKLIHKERLEKPEAVKRFKREIQAVARLSHPNIVRAIDADECGDVRFFIMEYVKGSDLSQFVKQHGPLPTLDACEYIRQTALGLQHAAEQGMVHRDIKPHNLLLADPTTESPAVVKILDMGLARVAAPEDGSDGSTTTLTIEGQVVGTLDYLSPEQAMNAHTADIRADLYSLGCTFYFLLTGRPPFPGGDSLNKIMRHRLEQPTPIEELRPDVPTEVSDVVYRLMSKEPHDRFQTPAALADSLAIIIAQLKPGSSIAPPHIPTVVHNTGETHIDSKTPVEAAPAPRKRWPTRMLVAAALLVACLVPLGLSFWPTHVVPAPVNNDDVVREDDPAKKPKPPEQTPVSSAAPVYFTNSLGMKFALIPKGTSWLGGGSGEPGDNELTIRDDFFLGVHEVTQHEWEALMSANPSSFSRMGEHAALVKELADADLKQLPVENVSCADCRTFLQRLNDRVKEAGWIYRLPTEAEWEYACRGGPTEKRADTSFDFYLEGRLNSLPADRANFSLTELKRPGKTATYPPNRLGLHDMHGNVAEWCCDENDPAQCVIRGGGWYDSSVFCRAANRIVFPSSSRASYIGLRIARIRRQ